MRKKYDTQNNTRINNYFISLILTHYIIPSLILLVFVFVGAILGFQWISQFVTDYTMIGFIYLISINLLITIVAVSVYHTIKTCVYGYNQISNEKYTVLQLKCINKRKTFLAYKCTLSDGREYKIYDEKEYSKIQLNGTCDLIILTNEYGAKLWEIVVVSNN